MDRNHVFRLVVAIRESVCRSRIAIGEAGGAEWLKAAKAAGIMLKQTFAVEVAVLRRTGTLRVDRLRPSSAEQMARRHRRNPPEIDHLTSSPGKSVPLWKDWQQDHAWTFRLSQRAGSEWEAATTSMKADWSSEDSLDHRPE